MNKILVERVPGGLRADFRPYRAYLKEARDIMPEAARDYLSGMAEGKPGSFDIHDGELIFCTLEENQDENDIVSTRAELHLALSTADLRLRYKRVLAYSLNMDRPDNPSLASSTIALLFDEMTLTDKGHLRHELLWNNGSTVIVSEGFDYRVAFRPENGRSKGYLDIRCPNVTFIE